jgi:hypothetical protein|tara:strand:+ start:59 stop:355 length:297 start_codon:yes stop_codon:yes gene_type:complete
MKYKFVQGATTQESAIKIDEGKYKDVILTYGKVGLHETDNECRLQFDYYVVENSERVTDDAEFKEVAGDILVDILENHTEEFEYGNDRDNNSEESDSQ